MTEAAHAILVVDDEPQLRRLLRTTLVAEGFRVFEADTARRGLIEAASHKPDLVILDLGLPDADGHAVVRGIREWSTLPIVVLSARVDEPQKVAALDAGADDYVTKPFSVGELLARVRAALRRAARAPDDAAGPLRFGDVEIDLARRRASRGGEPLHFTPIEYRLLGVLAQHAGTVATQRLLLREVWGPEHVDDPHYLRVYMKQLRQKIEPDPARPRYLQTETGVGYRLQAD
ncbi:MAG TPA: response regulator [Burkholderiaceae bacterium]|nr:response regulator [Burkholderiaceae bacterium]HQR70950.1 response regulator [Burkholderiaceae bacterium]